MRLARILVLVVVIGALVAAFVIDAGDRPDEDPPPDAATSVPVATAPGVWFCPGGSAPGGVAAVALELANTGSEPATAIVAGIRSGAGDEPRTVEAVLDPGERRLVRLADLVTDSEWMGAVVEVASDDVVVEQTFAGPEAIGSDRATCHTGTATTWIVPSGATRVTEFGEQMSLLVLNPFLDDAVIDVAFDSDTGLDSLDGVVIPARRVVEIDVTEEVTVASRVSAVIEVVAGRVAVSRIQVVDNAERHGLTVTPASAEPAPVWYLPTVQRGSRDDVITVVNPSTSATAEVDLEIIADGETRPDPIELTVRPGRSVTVPLADEVRLDGIENLSIVARSLTGVPIAIMQESWLPFGDGPVSNLSATAGADAAALSWLAPMESDFGSVVIVNPSDTSIATATVSTAVGGEIREVAEVEIGPNSRTELLVEDLGGDRPVVVIEASSPVVVGREIEDVSVHGLLTGIAVDETVIPE